ncbi:MAG: hypothetical protein RLZZ519_1732 [Bacteroidota bacterium]|jgi:hypothetical protein
MMDHQVLTFAQIKEQFPDQWVLIGNPVLDDSFVGSIVSKLLAGVVLFGSKDRKGLGIKANAARQGYEEIACVYTGEISQNRKFWL